MYKRQGYTIQIANIIGDDGKRIETALSGGLITLLQRQICADAANEQRFACFCLLYTSLHKTKARRRKKTMALVTMKRLFDHAMKEKYTVGAYNAVSYTHLDVYKRQGQQDNGDDVLDFQLVGGCSTHG